MAYKKPDELQYNYLPDPTQQKQQQQGQSLPAWAQGLSDSQNAAQPKTPASILQAAQSAKQANTTDWAQTAADLYGQITNRPAFQYDVNNDALYQSYRDQYVRAGQRAMQDTMGQAAGLTGGYGSTYGQAVGNQAYNDYMTKLNAEIPNLYAQARSAYDKETDDLYNRLNYAAGMEAQAYNRSRDAIEDERYNDERDYSRSRDEIEDERWQQQWEYNQGRDAISDARYQQEWEANQAYQRWQMDRTNTQDAREYALMMIQMGQMPSEDALAATGWNLEDVQAMVNYYAQQIAASQSSGSGGGGGGGYYYTPSGEPAAEPQTSAPTSTNDNYNGIVRTLYTYAQNGDEASAIALLNKEADNLTADQLNWIIEHFETWFGRKPESQSNSNNIHNPRGTGGGTWTNQTK